MTGLPIDPPPGCPDEGTLRRYLGDEFAPEEDSWVESHVGACQRCKRVLDRLVGSLPGLLGPLAGSKAGPGGDTPPALPGYEPVRRIEAGGTGVVWRMRDLRFRRD